LTFIAVLILPTLCRSFSLFVVSFFDVLEADGRVVVMMYFSFYASLLPPALLACLPNPERTGPILPFDSRRLCSLCQPNGSLRLPKIETARGRRAVAFQILIESRVFIDE